MIPYTEIEIRGIKHYLHGVVHPVIGCSLRKEYVSSLREYVLDRINKGEIWFAESGLERLFDLPIQGIPNSRKFFLKLPYLSYVAKFFLRLIPKTQRQIFAEQMTSIDELVGYREMFQAPENLIKDLDLYLSGKSPLFYKSLIMRCQKEYDFLKTQNQSTHFLCGISHEFVIKYLNN